MTKDEELKRISHGRIYRVLHYEVVTPHPPSKEGAATRRTGRGGEGLARLPKSSRKHLSWRKAGRGCWELITDSNGAISVRRETQSKLRNAMFAVPCSYIFTSQGRTYGLQRVDKKKNVYDLVNNAKNAPVLRITGIHYNGGDGTSVSLAGQREIRFPVRGYKKCALMSAMDDAGNSLVEYRPVRGTNNLAVDAVINPNALTVPKIELLVAVSARLLFGYFIHPGSGG